MNEIQIFLLFILGTVCKEKLQFIIFNYWLWRTLYCVILLINYKLNYKLFSSVHQNEMYEI